MVPVPVWTGAENLAPTGIRPLNRTDRSESLYRLIYPGPPKIGSFFINVVVYYFRVQDSYSRQQSTQLSRESMNRYTTTTTADETDPRTKSGSIEKWIQ